MTGTGDSRLTLLFRVLVAYRLLIYLGGLIVISLPVGLAWVFGIELSAGTRTAIVVVTLGLMTATYVGERQVGLDHVDPATGDSRESYSLRLRVSVGLGVLGIAVGVFLLLEDEPGLGLLFLAGSVLFFQLGYMEEQSGEED